MSEFLLIAATDVRQHRPTFKRVQVGSTFRGFYFPDLSLPERAADSGVPSATEFLDFFYCLQESSRGPAQRLIPSRRRFTLTRRTVDKHDSIGLVVASFRHNTAPIPMRCPVSAFDDAAGNAFPLRRDCVD